MLDARRARLGIIMIHSAKSVRRAIGAAVSVWDIWITAFLARIQILLWLGSMEHVIVPVTNISLVKIHLPVPNALSSAKLAIQLNALNAK